MGQHAFVHQADGSAQHHSDLAVVAAGVGGAGIGAGVRVFVDDEAVQFPDDGHSGAFAAADEIGAQAGHTQVAAEGEAH